jgi:hypothetical protein
MTQMNADVLEIGKNDPETHAIIGVANASSAPPPICTHLRHLRLMSGRNWILLGV